MRAYLGLRFFLLGISLVACVSKGDTIISQGPTGVAGAGGSGAAAGAISSGGSGAHVIGGSGSSGSGATGGQPGGGAAGSGLGGADAAGGTGICVSTPDSCNAAATRFSCGRCGVDVGCHSLLDQVESCGGCDRACDAKTECKANGDNSAFGCASAPLASLSPANRNLDQIAPPHLLNGSVFVFEGPGGVYSLRRYSDQQGSNVLDATHAIAAAGDDKGLFVLDGLNGVVRVGDDGGKATQEVLSTRINVAAAAGGGLERIAVRNNVVAWTEAHAPSKGILQWCLYAANRTSGVILSPAAAVEGCTGNALLGVSSNYVLGIAVGGDDRIVVTSTQKITTIHPVTGSKVDIPLSDDVPFVCWGDVVLSEDYVFFFGGKTDPRTIQTGTAIGCSIYRSKRDGSQETPELLLGSEQGGIVNDATQVGFRSPRLRYLDGFLYFLVHRPTGGSAAFLDTVMRVPATLAAPVAPGLFTTVVDPNFPIEANFSISGDTMTFQGRTAAGFSVRKVGLK